RVVGDDDRERTGLERQPGGIAEDVPPAGIQVSSGPNQRGRRVDGERVVAEPLEISGNSSFSAADLERPSCRRRNDVAEEGRAVGPVVVVPGLPGPGDPVLSL